MWLFGKLVLLLFFLFTAPSMGEIKSLKIRSDNRPLIFFQTFGFTDTGFISVAISSVSVSASSTVSVSPPDPSTLGFFLLSENSIPHVLLERQQHPNFCLINSYLILPLFTFRQLSPPPHSSFNQSYHVTYPDDYSLFFINCNPESLVTMDVRTEMYNTHDGTTKNYLSAGLTQLPSLYFIFSHVYLCFLGFWSSVCFKNKPSVHRIHLLMGGLLVMKALSLFCAAEDHHYVKATGTSHGWNVAFYIFQFIKDELLFTVMVLIGTRWSFLMAKKVLMIVIPLQVLGNVASVVRRETGPLTKEPVICNQVFMWVDIICCCAVVFRIGRSIRETAGQARKSSTKFWKLVIVYLYFTRIVVLAVKAISTYKYQWAANAGTEITDLVFYVVVFYMFRPV